MAGLFCIYLLAGFFLVPDLVRSEATKWARTNLDKEIALGDIHFNPFTTTLEINKLSLPGADGPIVSVGRLRISFSLLSLLQSSYRFGEVRLEKPYLHLVVHPDGTLNLAELEPRVRSKEPSPAVRIDTLSVDDGRIVLLDQSQAGQPREVLAPIDFDLKDFHSKSDEGGDFTLDAKSQRDEHFTWKGNLSIAPIASRGQLTVAALQNDTIERFLGSRLPITLTGGVVSFRSDYDVAYDAGRVRLRLTLPSIVLAGFSADGKKELFNGRVKFDRLSASVGPIMLATGKHTIASLSGAMRNVAIQNLSVAPLEYSPDERVAINGIRLANSRFDYGNRWVELGSLTLEAPQIDVRREHDGKISLMAMLPRNGHPSTASAATDVPAQTPPVTPWKIALKQFAINGGTLRLVDRTVRPEAQIIVSPLILSAAGLGSDLTQTATLHFDATINGGRFTGDGTVTPAGAAGDLKFVLADLPLRPFVGYAPPMPGLDLRSGDVSSSGDVHFQGTDIAKLTFRGDAAITRLDLQEVTTKSPLFAWRSLALTAIDCEKSRATIERAQLVRPVGQVAVLADRRFNFAPLMASRSSQAAVPIQSRPAQSAAMRGQPALRFKLGRLDITGGTMGFADYSIDPNFRARIDALAGHIANITNAPGEAATIALSGHVIDRYSPVTIKGKMDLSGYDRLTDVQLAFRNIDLPVFNPYSGRYAGYAIDKGKLTTELSYKIDHRQLQAQQHVVIDQLEWGQATASKDRVPLPIRLASALLKDKDGVIDLNLPLSGSLDDPKFSVWPLIWQIVGNVIEKAVTAPFQLIGALFSGAEKAQYIDFMPGEATLPQGSAEALHALAKAMVDRPVLKLDIPAGPSAGDADSVADTRIDQALMAREIKRGEKADIMSLDGDTQHDRLQDLYRAKFGKRPQLPEFTADQLKNAPDVKPDAGEGDRRTSLESQWMRDQLRAEFKPSNAELEELGTERAKAVRDALLAGGAVDPARVFLTTALSATDTEGHSRLALKFE